VDVGVSFVGYNALHLGSRARCQPDETPFKSEALRATYVAGPENSLSCNGEFNQELSECQFVST